jgi:hypothetical protein
MTVIPVDLQRKFEQRWAARFLQPPPAPRAHRSESQGQQLAAPKIKRKNRRVETALQKAKEVARAAPQGTGGR